MTLQGEVVSQRLARMLQIAERVDHRYRRVLGHAGNGFLRKRTQDDAIHPAFKVMCDVAQLLACIQPALSLIDKEGIAAHASHAGFEGEARAQGRFFEEHYDLLTGKRLAKI